MIDIKHFLKHQYVCNKDRLKLILGHTVKVMYTTAIALGTVWFLLPVLVSL